MTGTAYFVRRPRTIDDLYRPHLIEAERPFEVVRVVTLAGIDYENFATDMLADRQFLEDYASLCSKAAPVLNCLFVKYRRGNDGILVVPNGAFVYMAAYYSNPDADR